MRASVLGLAGSVIVMVGLLTACEDRNSTKEPDMKDNAENELTALEKEWAQAFIKNDAEAIARYMADDWTVISPDGNVIDKATFLGLIKSGVLTHDDMEFTEVKARVYGDTAVVTSRATSKGKFGGEAFSELERSTDFFVKQKGQWKSVVTHLTRIAKKQGE
jgi:ketosteroid isomerase-like protein